MNIHFHDNNDWAPPGSEGCRSYPNFEAFLRAAAEEPFIGVRMVQPPPGRGDALWLAVDLRSSAPVYFRRTAAGYALSSSGFDLINDTEPLEPDNAARLYFLRQGCTPGADTLFCEVKRIPPGAALRISDEGSYTLHSYDLAHLQSGAQAQHLDYPEAKAALRTHLERIGAELSRRCCHKRVVLPLTAGRDSRTIAALLKMGNRHDVYCITYGRATGNHDLDRARIVARKLGYPLRHLPSVPEPLPPESYTRDPGFRHFARYLGGLGACYFYQEYQPALRLQGEGILDTEAIVLPGHNGDIVGGASLIYPQMHRPMSIGYLSRLLLVHEHSVMQFNSRERRQLRNRLRILLSDIDLEDSRKVYEIFRSREDLSKYLFNSGRSWRYFGAEVYNPFIDPALIAFALNLPFAYRYGKRIWDDVTDELFAETGLSLPDDNRMAEKMQSPLYRTKQRLRPYMGFLWAHRRQFLNEPVGFAELMAPLMQEIAADGHYKPLSYNGLSFAWFLRRLDYFR